MRNKYRIVTDSFLGFEVQIKRWRWPFWVECNSPGRMVNTHGTLEEARKFAADHRKGFLVEELPADPPTAPVTGSSGG